MGKYTAQVQDHLVLPALVRLPLGEEQHRRLTEGNMSAPAHVRLLIDTGSKRTTLIPGVLQYLQPQTGTVVQVETPFVTGASTLFWVRLEFPEMGLAAIPAVQVARLSMPPTLGNFHGLLGRDLLRSWESFLYEGRRGRYTLRDTPGGLFGWLRR